MLAYSGPGPVTRKSSRSLSLMLIIHAWEAPTFPRNLLPSLKKYQPVRKMKEGPSKEAKHETKQESRKKDLNFSRSWPGRNATAVSSKDRG